MPELIKKYFSEAGTDFIAAAGVLLIAVLLAGFFTGRLIQKLIDRNSISKERNDAVKRSRSVLGGQFAEQIAPFFPDFPCNPGDVRFIGKPVDFIAFSGSAEGKELTEILFIEVKSGESQLSEREKQIKTLVEQKKIRYVEYRIPSEK